MSKKRAKQPRSKADLVIAPGGPRAKRTVHEVPPGHAVDMAAAGAADTQLESALVLTPGGFRPRSFVHRIEAGHVLQMSERQMRVMDASMREVFRVSPRVAPPAVVPALGSGWIAYAYWNNGTGSSVSSFRTTWRVPPPPASGSTHTMFLFNGIQNYGMNFGILQPVLQWGPSAAGGGAYWTIASWYVTSGGDAFHTPLVRVHPNDLLVGVMTLTGQSGNAFNYTSEFEGRAGTSLPVQNIAELLWCNETLEAYNIEECTNYPATQMTALESIQIQTGASTPVVNWTEVNAVTDCGQHVVILSNSGSNGRVDIHYRWQKSRFEELNLLSAVTNAILLWLYRHGWEDPGWGRGEAAQATIMLAIHELAGQIADEDLRRELKKTSNAALKRVVQRMEDSG
jgi:hypothetical protein